MSTFTENDYYSRQNILENFGPKKQELLRKSHVIVAGAGGLGCPALQYLTGAGVGKITIIDGDKVQVHNLHRQILYGINDIGHFKAKTAAENLSKLNPFITINYINVFITEQNIDEIITDCDVVLDATDNFETRFLLGDFTARKKIPLVYAAIYAYEGQLTVFNYKNGPSFRNLFPDIADSKAIPNCATNGVIGFVPGLLGILQAAEAIKIIVGLPEVFSGKLQLINLLNLKIKEFYYHKSDISVQVSTLQKKTKYTGIQEITSRELFRRLNHDPENIFLLDVREPYEWEQFNIGGTLIPMSEVGSGMNEIPRDMDIVVICHKGYRSYKVAEMLVNNQEFKNVFSLKGGLAAWTNEFGE